MKDCIRLLININLFNPVEKKESKTFIYFILK